MRLKRRILISIILCLLLPLLLILLVVLLILQFQAHLMSVTYNANTNSVELIQNSPSLFESMVKEDYNELLEEMRENPAQVMEEKWLKSRNEELLTKHSFLCLRVDDEVVYVGNREFFESLKWPLPAYRDADPESGQSIFLEGESYALIRKIDERGPNRECLSLFLITDINHLLPQWKRILIEALIALLVALTVTTIVVATTLSRSIAKPLAEMGEATKKIREGNLDSPLPQTKKDEIGQLQKDFEAMREHLKEMSESRDRYEQDYHDMIANISHDLKTPLTALRGYAEGLLDGVADTPEKRERYYRTIRSKAGDMEKMVEELAFFAKIEQQALTFRFRELPLHEFMADCIEDSALDLETQGIALSYEERIPEGLTVVFDPEYIKRALVNIIGNAVKYMDKETGRIVVSVEPADAGVRISVADNGCGIPEEDMPYIFDRFYRGDASRGTKKGGSGLGLSIVKSIMIAHGGSVEAESEVGKGTTVRLFLPLQNDVGEHPAKEEMGGKRWKRRKNKKS